TGGWDGTAPSHPLSRLALPGRGPDPSGHAHRALRTSCSTGADGLEPSTPPYRFTSNPSLSLAVFGKTEAAGQRGVGEEGDPVDLAAAQGEHHHAPGLRAQVVAEGRLAVGAGRAYL